MAMVFSHCWVGSPARLCLPATTSFEFLIRKPPCNYWINVNYESWLGLRHHYCHHRARVELSLPLLHTFATHSLSPTPSVLSLSFSSYASYSLNPTSPIHPLSRSLFVMCSLSSIAVRLLRSWFPLSFAKAQRGLGIIKIRWLICKFNKITVLGMPTADKRLYLRSLYRETGVRTVVVFDCHSTRQAVLSLSEIRHPFAKSFKHLRSCIYRKTPWSHLSKLPLSNHDVAHFKPHFSLATYSLIIIFIVIFILYTLYI